MNKEKSTDLLIKLKILTKKIDSVQNDLMQIQRDYPKGAIKFWFSEFEDGSIEHKKYGDGQVLSAEINADLIL